MNEAEKSFFSKILDNIEKRLEKIEIHQQKTCDELDEVDKKMIGLATSFKNHLDFNQVQDNRKFTSKINRPQWALVILTAITVSAAFLLR